MHEPLLKNEKELKALVSDSNDVATSKGKRDNYYGNDDSTSSTSVGLCCWLCSCRPRCSGNIKTLITVIILFSVVSIAQLLGSFISNSLALLGDSISMGIDTLTFCGNLYAECSVSRHRVTIQLVASGVSLLALSLFTISVIVEAVDRLMYSDKCTVDPYIVLGFSFVGLCFDVICFIAYYYWGSDPFDPSAFDDGQQQQQQQQQLCQGTESEAEEGWQPKLYNHPAKRLSNGFHSSRPPHDQEMGDKNEGVHGGGGSSLSREPTALQEAFVKSQMARMNMCSALMHVGSDALRSITTLIEGLLILYTDLDSENTDAVASLIVSTIIVIGTIGALYEWAHQCSRHYRGELLTPTPSDLATFKVESKAKQTSSQSTTAADANIDSRISNKGKAIQGFMPHNNSVSFSKENSTATALRSRYQALER